MYYLDSSGPSPLCKSSLRRRYGKAKEEESLGREELSGKQGETEIEGRAGRPEESGEWEESRVGGQTDEKKIIKESVIKDIATKLAGLQEPSSTTNHSKRKW